MSKKSKIVLIFALTVLVIIIIIVISIIGLKKEKKEELSNAVTWTTTEVTKNRKSIALDRYAYNNVVSGVQAYLNYLNVNNTSYFRNDGTKAYTDKEINEIIYNLLSENYLNNNKNITIDNIDKYIKKYNEQTVFIPINMECIKKDDISTYVVEGIIENLEYKVLDTKRFIININTSKMNFSIESTEKEYTELVSIEASNVDIKENTYNKISSKKVNTENISTDYFSKFKRLCLSAPEVAYKYLDEEYKNVRFGNVENFKNYIKVNSDEFKTYAIKKYLTNNYSENIEYVCMDQYENTYMFNESTKNYNAMEYTVKLDTYTIPTEKFTTTYNSTDDQNKVMMNVDKWIQMLNTRDYTAAYNVLDETFKKNNFDSEEKFEQYMRAKFPLHYKVEFTSFSDENGTFVQKITLSDITGTEIGTIEKSIIMQLKDNLDFVMSFEI